MPPLSSSGLYYKYFMIVKYDCKCVIYDRNDSSLYYKTMIVNNLALEMIINYVRKVVIYNHKVHYKLKRTLRL
jgi:hypothetical protein